MRRPGGPCWRVRATWGAGGHRRRAYAAQQPGRLCAARAFDERSDIYYYRVIQSIHHALAAHEVRLRTCALEENDSDANQFLARMNEPETEAAILLGIDDPHIHDLAVDLAKPCVLINCRDEAMRLSSIAPDHRLIGQFAAQYLFDMGHRAVLNVMCLRRYTMDLRLAGIKEAADAQPAFYRWA